MKNGQGDIEGILDTTGALVVSYTYDAWGKTLSVTGTLASTVGAINPMRYRDYYLDSETGYYYLQSRYYNPDFCRFINSDEPSMLTLSADHICGVNLFAHCQNNPVMYSDPSGYRVVSVGSRGGTAFVLGLYVVVKRNHGGIVSIKIKCNRRQFFIKQ